MDPVLFITTLAKIPATAVSVIRFVDYFAGHQPVHVKVRLARSLERMSEYINEKNQSEDPGDTWRNDWFSENEVSGNRIPQRLLEKTITEIIDDSAERKSEYIAKFWVNVCRTSNADIDEETAFSYFETIESLSWRQLCILRLAILSENEEVVISFRYEYQFTGIESEHWGRPIWVDTQLSQIPKNERTIFNSISRDFRKLADAGYINASFFEHIETKEKYIFTQHTVDCQMIQNDCIH